MSQSDASGERKPLTLAEVKALVFEKWTSNMERLNLDQKRLLTYLSKFTKVEDATKAREVVDQLVERFNLKEEHAVMLVNVLPKSVEELKAYLYKDYPLLGESDYKEMLNLLKGLKEEE